MRIASVGQAAFAAAMIALGLLGVARGDFVAMLLGVQALLAAALAAVQMGLFTVLVRAPAVVTGPSASQ